MAAKAESFFLEGNEPTEDVKFIPPPRPGCKLEPLVDGVATFQSMEEAILAAEESVYIAFWIFNPKTPVQSDKVKKLKLGTWLDLLAATAKRGVDVRILLTDFDGLFQDSLHRNNFLAYRTLVSEAKRLGSAHQDRLQVIVSMHSATVSFGLAKRLEKERDAHIARLNAMVKKKGEAAALERYALWPRLWLVTEYQKTKKTFVARTAAKLVGHPAAHHQKIVIVDQRIAYCGGLDVNTGRIDTPKHAGPGNWHDVDVKIEGMAAVDVCRNFVGRWNVEAPLFTTFLKAANATSPPAKMVVHTANADLKLKKDKPKPTGKVQVQIHRTASKDNPLGAVPTPTQTDLKEGYKRAISLAESFIYIENQYVRSPDLGDWIVARAKAKSDLRVIVVLPVAPEEVAKSGKGDEITEHGLYLQHEVLSKLRKDVKHLGLYSIVRKTKGTGSKTDSFGSPQIYMHSKLLIVDDVYANVGSANTNPRSFEVDTEIAAAFYDQSIVPALRLRLWRELLGDVKGMSSWTPADFVKQWDLAAAANKGAAKPGDRKGFVVQHDENVFKGTKSSLVPNEFALLDQDRTPLPDDVTAIA